MQENSYFFSKKVYRDTNTGGSNESPVIYFDAWFIIGVGGFYLLFVV